jgi:predicted O-linked N-acetylglucosamine transferase (SPINDLY family)
MEATVALERARSYIRQGRVSDAERLCRGVLEAKSDHCGASDLLGAIMLQQGRYDDALALLSNILTIHPDSAPTLLLHGQVLQRLGRHAEAIDTFNAALGRQDDLPAAHVGRATSLQCLGRSVEAIVSFDRALTMEAQSVVALAGRGSALHALGRNDEAMASLQAALAIEPEHVEALYGVAQVLQSSQRFPEALEAYCTVLALRPEHVDALLHRGIVQHLLGDRAAAVTDFDGVLELDPRSATAAYNRGVVLLSLGRRDDAIASFNRALAIRHDYADALHNLAIALSEIELHDEARACYERLVAIDPEYPHALGNLAHYSAQVGLLTGREALIERLEEGVRRGRPVSVPFVFMSLSHDASAQLSCASLHAAARHPFRGLEGSVGKLRTHERVRVAYISANFHDHAMAYLLAGVFEQHDRDRFEVTAISLGPDSNGPMRRRLVPAFDRFVDARQISDQEVARIIGEGEIDIAVDLMGYTGDARPDILAYRPAPIQVNYLGYPGTMGASYIDYILADRFVIPREFERYYSENVVCLPDTFQANDSRRVVADSITQRKDFGLPDAGMVFCSFNNTYKISPAMFAIWMRLLQQVDGSVLWLLGGREVLEGNLRHEARVRGVDPGRLVFAPRIPYEEHLARYRHADLFLDTLPFNAGTTASDALWAGLPVLTCAGQAFSARMAGSLLVAAGLPELVTYSLEEYESVALTIGLDPHRARALRKRLTLERERSTIFDTARFSRHLELAYLKMQEVRRSGALPRSFEVAPMPS